MSEKRILLIEDDGADAALILRVLDRSQPATLAAVARTGDEAFEMLAQDDSSGRRRPPPDLILLDWNLPGPGGAAVLERLRAEPRTRWLPVVVVTGAASRSGHADAYRLGANSYVVKASDATEFADTIEQVARYWLGVNEPPPWVN
ncbi:MAG TPA: response regulator [Magnetospirillaceae bacterium]|nr:response regulator [Magnetospirillaceae bacterium]